MHWQISDSCNYRCSCCCEGRAVVKKTALPHVTEETAHNMMQFLSRLEPGWTVRLSAGEPSLHPRAAELASSIVAAGIASAWRQTSLPRCRSSYCDRGLAGAIG